LICSCWPFCSSWWLVFCSRSLSFSSVPTSVWRISTHRLHLPRLLCWYIGFSTARILEMPTSCSSIGGAIHLRAAAPELVEVTNSVLAGEHGMEGDLRWQNSSWPQRRFICLAPPPSCPAGVQSLFLLSLISICQPYLFIFPVQDSVATIFLLADWWFQ
jgi:hypothetical protein